MFEAEVLSSILFGFLVAVLFCMVAAPDASEFREWEREHK